MSFQIVSIDYEFRIELPLEVHVEDRLYEMLRAVGDPNEDKRSRLALSRRFVDLITAMIDGEMPPPTLKQTQYAVAVARELNIELPSQVLCYRDAMTRFLTQHTQRFRDSRALKRRQLGKT
ncbi:MAG: hypothetical protein EPN60_01985 [Nevskiaceae bacterium]|nr:MAG: hypothetical protein EPN60_01985 [Nevskiaceae bacterium]